MAESFQLKHVLAVASKHPIYSSNQYPLTPHEVANIAITYQTNVLKLYLPSFLLNLNMNSVESRLATHPIIRKDDM